MYTTYPYIEYDIFNMKGSLSTGRLTIPTLYIEDDILKMNRAPTTVRLTYLI